MSKEVVMRKPVIVYGGRILSEMLYYDSLRHPDFKIAAFARDEAYLDADTFLDRPLVSIDSVNEIYSPDAFDMIVLDATYKDMRNRGGLYLKAKHMGYRLRNYISPSSMVSPDIVMGENNVIFEQAHLGIKGKMGSYNTIRQQVYLGHHFLLGDKNVLTPSCTIGSAVVMENDCYIGIGATITNNIKISEGSLIGAGSVVIRDIEPFSKNVGNPSRIISYYEV